MNMKKTVFILLALLFCRQAGVLAKNLQPSSREYKILLKAERFVSAEEGCELFWQLVEKVSTDFGLKTKAYRKEKPDREICFFDTVENDLYRQGFILRLRAEEITRKSENEMLPGLSEAELTLKFRAPELESVQNALIEPASSLNAEYSCEEDLVVKGGAAVIIFSASSKIPGLKRVPAAVEDLFQFFPGMARLGLSAQSKLAMVNNVCIVEKRIQRGAIYFGDKKTKTIFSIWYEKGEKKPFVAEFSFKVDLDSKNRARRIELLEKINSFFVELARRGKFFVNTEKTKTASVYELK
jgi:hypothetical protein